MIDRGPAPHDLCNIILDFCRKALALKGAGKHDRVIRRSREEAAMWPQLPCEVGPERLKIPPLIPAGADWAGRGDYIRCNPRPGEMATQLLELMMPIAT